MINIVTLNSNSIERKACFVKRFIVTCSIEDVHLKFVDRRRILVVHLVII